MANEIRTQILENIDKLSEKLNNNVFIESARKGFEEKISDEMVSDEEKAKLITNYEAQVSIGVIAEIMKTAKEIPEIEAKIANIEKDTELKEQQADVIEKQVSTEQGKILLLAEQITSEKYRHKDLRSSTAVKLASLEVTKQQAKFEESRRYIALEANNQNAYMKKADYKVQQLQAIATDDDITISTTQMADAKDSIDVIPTAKITYNTEVEITKPAITNDVIPTLPINTTEE